MPDSMALVRLMTSGLISSASQWTSLSTSFRLMAVFALQHGDGQSPRSSACVLTAKRDTQRKQRPGVEQAVEEPRRVAKQAEFLLEIDVDAAEEDALLADVGSSVRIGV